MPFDEQDAPPAQGGYRWPVYLVEKAEARGDSGGFDLGAALRILRRRSVLILLCALFGAAVGAIYAALARPMYMAESRLIAVDKKSLTGSVGQLGGLAALAGIDLAGGGSAEPVAVLRSLDFAAQFIDKAGISADLLEADQTVLDKLGFGAPKDSRDAVRYFNSSVRGVSEDKKTGIVTLTINWFDANDAAWWANEMPGLLNERLRQSALRKAERNVEFLQKELEGSQLLALQQSVGRLLESELQQLMVARGDDEFAFRLVDPAIVPKKPKSPRRVLLTLGGGVLGALIGAAYALIRNRRELFSAPAVRPG